MGTLLYYLYTLTAACLVTSLRLRSRHRLFTQGFPEDPRIPRLTTILRHFNARNQSLPQRENIPPSRTRLPTRNG